MSRAAEAAMAASYKSLKEDFVSNLSGGEVSEINYVTAVAPVSTYPPQLEYSKIGKTAVILWTALQSRQLFFKPYTPLAFAVDFLLNVGAILLAITLYADTPLLLNTLLIAPTVLVYALPRTPPPTKKAKIPPSKMLKEAEPPNPLPKKSFLTTYRGCMMVITCLAILAVDFKIFPRRFAKVENWGTSLMDVGVGSFVFSAGVVAARPLLKEKLAGKTTRLMTNLYRSARHSLPLIVLGFIRLYTVKGLDYAEHVTEYGVHWNFFFTLGLLPPFVAVFQSAFQLIPSYAGLAILLGSVYQIILEFTDLKAFILTAPRTDLLSKNREGIFSFFGYLAIFLAGQSTGLFVIPRSLTSSSSGYEQRKKLLLTLGTWSGIWILLYCLSTNYSYGLSLSVSRRLANLPYFLWISAFNCSQLTAFCLVETFCAPSAHKAVDTKAEKESYANSTSRVLEAFNRNGLAIFLVANLLTGLVNLTIPTLHVSDIQAMGILLGYAAVLTGVAIGLDAFDISIKIRLADVRSWKLTDILRVYKVFYRRHGLPFLCRLEAYRLKKKLPRAIMTCSTASSWSIVVRSIKEGRRSIIGFPGPGRPFDWVGDWRGASFPVVNAMTSRCAPATEPFSRLLDPARISPAPSHHGSWRVLLVIEATSPRYQAQDTRGASAATHRGSGLPYDDECEEDILNQSAHRRKMSSAALQATPLQPTAVGSHSPGAASSANRPYTSGSSNPRDPYYNQTPTNPSPSSTRRPSRRPSGNGSGNGNGASANSQPPQPFSPAAAPAVVNPRGTSSNQTSSPTTAPSGYPAMAPGNTSLGVPPVVSARSSSNSRTSSAAAMVAAAAADRAMAARRAAAYANEEQSAHSPRGVDGSQDRERSNGQMNGAERERGRDEASAAATTASRRRRAHQSPGETLVHRPSGSREARGTPTRTSQANSPGLSRETSEVLNRVVVSKPEVDIDRERERMAEAVPSSPVSQATPTAAMNALPIEDAEPTPRGSRSRHDHTATKREKNSRFGEYYLGNTLGEGEFGKVKMGWKQEGGVQVAIKLIRRDSVGTNPTRLAKIYREISILREISHPNIVRLHEMVETEKQIGIILEYASGGELFDYILNHRYLKDNAARRLFAQLVSGVGYLHKKGIVHRDLKLENLLLDRNRNIIITDFGFANTFNPADELGEEIEHNLVSRDYVKRMELDKILPNGMRRGDLMQTSCGSPCYAAPELVVSDSLYTGRKVDVWSCGVILYAMLAGYLPFDDDPANPEGDNINLLYKYIVSTPLTFPEYVTPHARDLLRRILVPDPRKRADLFEVARHSWLSEYSHVVGFITSSTTTTGDIANTTVSSDDQQDAPMLARSASVREPTKTQKVTPTVGDLARKHGNVDQDTEQREKSARDNKRRTVQVEYVEPRSQTQRGEPSGAPSSSSKTRARAGSSGPVEVPILSQPSTKRTVSSEKALPQDPPVQRDQQYSNQRRPSSGQQGMNPPPARPNREQSRTVSDINHYGQSGTRPATGGSMTSIRSGPQALPTRGSYSQPAAPAVAGTNAHGRMSQPKPGKNYSISGSATEDDNKNQYGQPNLGQAPVPDKFARVTGLNEGPPVSESRGHKRSNTIGGIFSRTNSIFSGKSNTERPQEKTKKSYPPVSMSGAVNATDEPRQSIDSRRSISFGFGKKRSGSISGSQSTDKPRRFSLLPASFSLKAIGIGKESGSTGPSPLDQHHDQRSGTYGNYPDHPQSAREVRNVSTATAVQPPYTSDGPYVRKLDSPLEDRRGSSTASPQHHRYAPQPQTSDPRSGAPPQFLPPLNFRQGESMLATESESSLGEGRRGGGGQYPTGFNDYDDRRPVGRSQGKGVLQKNNRKFTDAWEQDQNNGYGPTHVDNGGSSGAARRVMDFFRKRAKARVDDR
ncbi:hypothetical protein B7494_g8016 [Chlorociboria aeruginascens]|nr:hypothetical protein B7494_g8016 [Chlorociboria aeruginascens]